MTGPRSRAQGQNATRERDVMNKSPWAKVISSMIQYIVRRAMRGRLRDGYAFAVCGARRAGVGGAGGIGEGEVNQS